MLWLNPSAVPCRYKRRSLIQEHGSSGHGRNKVYCSLPVLNKSLHLARYIIIKALIFILLIRFGEQDEFIHFAHELYILTIPCFSFSTIQHYCTHYLVCDTVKMKYRENIDRRILHPLCKSTAHIVKKMSKNLCPNYNYVNSED